MRKIIYLTQDEIDDLVQNQNTIMDLNYHSLRALQDGYIDKVTYPDRIIYRRNTDNDEKQKGVHHESQENS